MFRELYSLRGFKRIGVERNGNINENFLASVLHIMLAHKVSFFSRHNLTNAQKVGF